MEMRGGGHRFDGIICIGGEDWWYHNRGHFDFQIMRRLAREWPVLFVNSIGVRFPQPGHGGGGQLIARLRRKLGSLGRGLTHVENGFHVLSPLSVPGSVGQAALGWALGPQIRLAAQRIGIERPLLWVHCPAGVGLIDGLRPVATVLQRTDRFEAFPEGDPVALGKAIEDLKQRVDLAVYCNKDLLAEERHQVRRSVLVTHGVDFDAFAGAGDAPASAAPVDIAAVPSPRVGFIGGIDAHTFDPELFLEVARRLGNVHFAMIGGCSLREGWCPHANVHFLGRKPYEQIPAYMAACDALIMPWNRSDWIKGCNPIKLKEYLAVGRPVVTTSFPALEPYRDLVRVADTPEGFAEAVRRALTFPRNAAGQRERVRRESWDAKAAQVREALLDLALPSTRPSRRAA